MIGLEGVRHREMMASPKLWPLHPVLPLVRNAHDGRQDLGVLIDHPAFYRPHHIAVIRANLLMLPDAIERLAALTSETFTNFDAILAAGWSVD